MAPRRKGEVRQRHGTRRLILNVFAEAGASSSLATAAISEKVSRAAGKMIPDFSIYSALRTLVRRKELRVTREGRENLYSIAVRRSQPPRAAAPSLPVGLGPERATRSASPAPPAPTAPTPLHKLAIGEALILNVGEDHLEVVTNVHGKLIVERHHRRRQD